MGLSPGTVLALHSPPQTFSQVPIPASPLSIASQGPLFLLPRAVPAPALEAPSLKLLIVFQLSSPSPKLYVLKPEPIAVSTRPINLRPPTVRRMTWAYLSTFRQTQRTQPDGAVAFLRFCTLCNSRALLYPATFSCYGISPTTLTSLLLLPVAILSS